MSAAQLKEFLRCLKEMPREKSEQGDLFGFDDSALKTAEKLSKLAAKHISEVKTKVNAAKNAIRNPEAARKLGVKVKKDAEKLLTDAQSEMQRWEHWYTDPELSAQLRREAGEETEKSSGEAKKIDKGRFNPESETPLLSSEEDANDFQLVGETAEDAKKADAAAETEKKAKQVRADAESKAATPDLIGGKEQKNPVHLRSEIRDVIEADAESRVKGQRLKALAERHNLELKDVQEETEAVLVDMTREIDALELSDDETFKRMAELYQKQPVLSNRTSTSIENQAYSTPVPLAWA